CAIAVDNRHKDDERCSAYEEGDDPFLQMIKIFHDLNSWILVDKKAAAANTAALLASSWCQPLWFISGSSVHFLDEVGTDPVHVVFMRLVHRFFPCTTLLGGQGDELRLPRLFPPCQGFVVVLLGHVVGELGGVLHGAFENGADIRRQAGPKLLVND